MHNMLGERLPSFSESEWEEVKGSSDFYGMNTYVRLPLSPLVMINTYTDNKSHK